VRELKFDPVEWRWKKQRFMKAIEFFNYSTKRGYKVGMQSVPTNLKLDEQLAQEGYNLKKTTKLYLSL
jgi:hypothetical protein